MARVLSWDEVWVPSAAPITRRRRTSMTHKARPDNLDKLRQVGGKGWIRVHDDGEN